MKHRLPNHVARDASEGKRPFLTCTIALETFQAIDRLSSEDNLSRGRLVDAAILAYALSRAKDSGSP